MRDWRTTLWPASFGGLPFYVEKEKDQFGKRIVVHEFPLSDEPFIEELGASARHFELNAYLASDSCDGDADALAAMLVSWGSQTLVLPDQGPVQAKAKNCTRDRERDKQGVVAFTLNFVADGAASPVVSGDYLGQLAFDAASALAGVAASLMGALSL